MAKLLETMPFVYRILESEKKPGVLCTGEGKFQHAGVKNANNRIYPKKIWDNILEDTEIQKRFQEREVVGELDHPAQGGTSLSRVSHVVTSHYMKPSGEIWGTFEVLDTPHGQIAAKLFEAKIKIGVSSRGDGSVVNEEGSDVVQDDYKFETYDLVLRPSTYGAYPSITESIEETEQNDQIILKAISSVASTTDDYNTLMECNKIIGTLNCDCSLCENIIKDKLTNNKNPLEVVMSVEKKGEKEMLDYIKEQADILVKDKISEKQKEIDDLNSRVVELVKTRDDLSKRMKIAEEIVETMTIKLKEFKHNKSTDETLKKRYNAACKIIEESVKKLKEAKLTARKLEAAEKLLAASLKKHKSVAVGNYVERALVKLPESLRSNFKNLLSECESPKEVNKKLEEVKGIVSALNKKKISGKEPLPLKGGTSNRIDETKRSNQTEVKDPILRKFLEKVQ